MKTKRKYCCLALLASLLVLSIPVSGQLRPQSAPANSTVITGVEVGRIDEQTTVRISGDHPLVLHTEHLTNPERVVLDFANARLGFAQSSAPSALKPVRGIRVGQFQPDVARVVVDLEASAPYKINAEGQSIKVAFAAASTAPAEKHPPAAALPDMENATPDDNRIKLVTVPARSKSEAQADTNAAGNVALPSREANRVPTGFQSAMLTLRQHDQPLPSPSTSETQADSLPAPVTTSLETGQVLTDGNGEGRVASGEAKPMTASPGPPAPSERAKGTREVIKAAEPSLPGYTIGEQDVLDIDVWREKELSGQVAVRPDGKITVPLVNEIYVLGLTPLQLQETLTEKLQPFVTAPQVTVSVREINSRKVYVMGQVAHQGAFHFNSSTTVSEIIVEAGGLREFAKHKDIYVLRNVNGKQVKLPFNYDAVIEGKESSQDLLIKPGDKIVVR